MNKEIDQWALSGHKDRMASMRHQRKINRRMLLGVVGLIFIAAICSYIF